MPLSWFRIYICIVDELRKKFMPAAEFIFNLCKLRTRVVAASSNARRSVFILAARERMLSPRFGIAPDRLCNLTNCEGIGIVCVCVRGRRVRLPVLRYPRYGENSG